MNEENYVSRVPWSMQPSLKEMSEEVGVDFDKLIEGIRLKKTDYELSEELGVPRDTVKGLREHFVKYGVHSIMGQD